MPKLLVIIPTYDEKDNVEPMSKAVLGHVPDANILFVDDNSPDGTGDIIDTLSEQDPRIHTLHRASKEGLGRAYIAAFKWALERDYDLIQHMDCDFSHDPAELPNFLKAAEKTDLVVGSRYVHGIRITNWPLRRLFLSKGAATYVHLITGLPISDPTGGFKCFRREVLEFVLQETIFSNGYSFQIEMTHRAWMKGYRITEIPIIFNDRHSGYSKMNTTIAREALFIVWKLALTQGFRRRPHARPPAEVNADNA